VETEFEELILENFGPFAGKHRLRLNEGPALSLIKGRNEAAPRLGANGVGKSKLLNAIAWCLFGKTADELSGVDIRPWRGGKVQTSVTVKLTTWDGDEGDRHTIKRTAGPNSLTIDGKSCKDADVETLLGMTLGVFRLAVFLGQGQPLFHDLANRDKLEFLVEVLGLDRWDGYSERAGKQVTELERQLDRVVRQTAANEARADELRRQVDSQKAEADSWEDGRATRAADLKKRVSALGREVDLASKRHGEVALKLDGAGLNLKHTREDAEKFRAAATKAELEHNNAVSYAIQVQRDHDRAKAQLDALRKNRQCPTCGQAIKRESHYLDNVDALEGEVRKYAKELSTTAVRDAKRAADKARVVADEWAAQVSAYRSEVDKWAADELTIKRQLTEYEVDLKHTKLALAEVSEGVNPHRGRLAELKKALRAASDDADALAKDRADREVQLERARYWVKGFRDIRLYVLEDVLGELEFATNAMLDAVGLIGWEMRYAVERETKSGTVQRGLITTIVSPDSGDAEVKFKSWSGGEAQRLRLAGALALSEVVLARAGVRCNLEVLDEPTRGLSDEGVDDLCEFLADRARQLGKSIYLVDHMAIESTRFDRVITVRKGREGSTIASS
jgi:DNA repair exonuclease SbcCD ATPase subunit